MSNSRKFRVWDSNLIYSVLTDTEQIRAQIEGICKEKEIHPDEIPHSLVPTELLYNITACFVAMVDRLETEDLIQSGNSKPNKINRVH